MAYKIEYADTALKQLKKMDKPQALRIIDFLSERVSGVDDPRLQGKALSGPLGTLWRYRLGDYRIICKIQDGVLVVLVLDIGHRKDIYR